MPRNNLKFGICVPESCKASDLQNSLQFSLDRVFLPEKIKAIAFVDPILCSTGKDLYPYTTGYYLTRLLHILSYNKFPVFFINRLCIVLFTWIFHLNNLYFSAIFFVLCLICCVVTIVHFISLFQKKKKTDASKIKLFQSLKLVKIIHGHAHIFPFS